MFLHLSDDLEAPPVAQADVRIGARFPTGAWRTGDIAHDKLLLKIPADLPVGSYDVVLGVYFWQTGERLSPYADDSGIADGRVKLGEVNVHSPGER